MTWEVSVRHHMSAGHRIEGLPGPGAKCANLHGHTFGIEWVFRVPTPDAADIEFASVKAKLRGWVNTYMDHGMLLYKSDPIAQTMAEHQLLGKVLWMRLWPTTEVIAMELRDAVPRHLWRHLARITVTEGPNNSATYLHDDEEIH